MACLDALVIVRYLGGLVLDVIHFRTSTLVRRRRGGDLAALPVVLASRMMRSEVRSRVQAQNR